MQQIKLTVFFDPPFWVGVFERELNGEYSVARTVFGAEPRDYEVFEFVIREMDSVSFSSPQEAEVVKKKVNPKRMQREINKEVVKGGTISKAQDALRLEQEKNKKERKSLRSKQKEQIKQERFDLRQKKKKEKKRGH